MCNYDYHLDQFKEFVNKNHGVIPSNTRDCFNIFFCNEEWIPLMCCEKIEFDKYRIKQDKDYISDFDKEMQRLKGGKDETKI